MPNGNWLSRSSYMPLVRKHIQGPFWHRDIGTDYWMSPGLLAGAAAATTDIENLTEGGWTATSLVDTAGSGADFMKSADKGTPRHFLTNAASDLLTSPPIFGDYIHAWQAMRVANMNALPKKLVAEFWGAMTVHSTDDDATGWGFLEDVGGTPVTDTTHVAFITSDSANFQMASNAGTPINGATDDANWHLFTIEAALGPALVYWYIDGALQGSLAVLEDENPWSFGFGVEAGGTNRPAMGPLHIYYSWSGVGSDLGGVPTSAAD